MPKAIEVANELRKLAEHLEAGGEVEIDRPCVLFSTGYAYSAEAKAAAKERFLAVARLMPRPIKKSADYGDLNFDYKSEFIDIRTKAPQADVCEMVEPAKPAVYKCHPILSAEEEVEVGQ